MYYFKRGVFYKYVLVNFIFIQNNSKMATRDFEKEKSENKIWDQMHVLYN